MEKVNISMYAVINSEGQWFRRKGYGGVGDSWTSDFTLARIYSKIGPARAVVSFFANHYPSYPTPKLAELCISGVKIVCEEDRVEKQKKKKELQKQKRISASAKHELEEAQKQLKEAEAKIKQLKGIP